MERINQSRPGLPPFFSSTASASTRRLHDNATNNSRMTAPIAGVYVISTSVDWTANATGERRLRLRVNGNNTQLIASDIEDSSPVRFQTVATVYRLAAGDYVEAVVKQTSGGALNAGASANLGFDRKELAMAWVGT